MPPSVALIQLRPDLVGCQLFASVPIALRSSLLELVTVRRGYKPGARLMLTTRELATGSAYLHELGLNIVVVSRREPSPYLTLALTERALAREDARLEVFVAASQRDARTLASCDKTSGYYSRFGTLLGYPDCCVAAAASKDRIFRDSLFNIDRQANLVDAALRDSTHLNFCCNILLRESLISQFGPTSLISHYPCSFGCPRTVNLAETYYKVLAEEWPPWGLQLIELLRSPVVLWSDRWWPPQFWDEMAGVAQLGGITDPATRRISGGCSIPLGHGRTPGGTLPTGAPQIEVRKNDTAFLMDDGEHTVSHAAAGSPTLLDWRSGHIG